VLYVDIPSRSDLERLIGQRDPASVSIYLPTTPVTPDTQADRIQLSNLARDAVDQLRAGGRDDKAVQAIAGHLDDLADDDGFWAVQARSLAIFATPGNVLTFRLANRLNPMIEVADRFYVKPLIRAVTVNQEALVLALSQNAVRVVEVSADEPATPVRVADMPKDMADAVGSVAYHSRAPRGRIQGDEGKKVRMAQFARAVDAALRDFLSGRETPLILAAAAPFDSIFRSLCSYPHLAGQTISGNPDVTPDHDLAIAARSILDALHAKRVRTFADLFEARTGQGRTTTDVAGAAKAATYGAIDTIAVDIDAYVPGTIDDADGSITLAEEAGADSYGITDEIVGRVLMTGGHVLAVRRDDVPGGGALAAILRYPL